MSVEATLTIGAVAASAGVRPSSIRYYESVGVLPEPERVSGQRRYGPETVRALGLIDVAQRAGFSLAEIRELMESSAGGHAAEKLRALAERKIPEVEDLIERATTMKAWLQIASACNCSVLEACVLFEEGMTLPSADATSPSG